MGSVADDLRARTAARVLALPVEARIQLALSLGDEDLGAFIRSSGLDPASARHRLREQRQRGRTPSGCAAGERP